MLRFPPAIVREPRAYLYRVARSVLHDKLLLVDREQAIFVFDLRMGLQRMGFQRTRQLRSTTNVTWMASCLTYAGDILQLRTAPRGGAISRSQELPISAYDQEVYALGLGPLQAHHRWAQ
jgi:hypothetical protein